MKESCYNITYNELFSKRHSDDYDDFFSIVKP